MDTIIVGIDVSKDRLDVAVRPRVRPLRSNARRGGSEPADRPARGADVGLEATGGFETVVAASLPAAGLPVVVVNPAQVRLSPKRSEARQDRSDRCGGDCPFRRGDQARAAVADEATRLLADLVARRRQIVEMIAAERQREER